MREISLSDTKSFNGRIEKNEPVRVYDCSGPWGDPDFNGTSEEGLPAAPPRLDSRPRRCRSLRRPRSPAAGQRLPHRETRRVRLANPSAPTSSSSSPASPPTAASRSAPPASPSPSSTTPDQGIITPEMEFIAIRENMRRAKIADMTDDIVRNDLDKQHAGSTQNPDEPLHPLHLPTLPAAHPRRDHPRVRPQRSRRRPRHHPAQRQPPGMRADDHRPQLPRQNQRQHRQLRRRLVASRKRSRKCAGPPSGAPTP